MLICSAGIVLHNEQPLAPRPAYSLMRAIAGFHAFVVVGLGDELKTRRARARAAVFSPA
jgi:hypothetical protein